MIELHKTVSGVTLVACLCAICSGGCAESEGPKPVVARNTVTNSIGMKLVSIPKGTFQMGSPPSEEGSSNNERQHEVTLTQDYYLGAFEVTQAQYEIVMGNNPSHFQGQVVEDIDSSNHPVERVSWDDAVEFCRRLSALPEEKRAGRVYQLPTEAQWEYACRAGSKTAYSFGESSRSLGDYAWFKSNSESKTHPFGKTHPVGKKKPNAWGLYDIHGNIWEWCSDWYAKDPRGSATDPMGSRTGSYPVLRGGSCFCTAEVCRSANRSWNYPWYRDYGYGFRVTWVPSGQ